MALKIGLAGADDLSMSRNPLRIVVASALYVLGLRWIVDSHAWSGPTLVHLTQTHGVHMNDWVTFALWTLALAVVFPAYSAGSWRRPQVIDIRDWADQHS